jgi:hypothetical protein
LELLNSDSDTGNVQAVVNISYNDSLSRNGSEIALILTNTEQYTPAELKSMLESPENFSMVLPIDYKYSDIQSLILESGTDYVLFYSLGVEDDFSADFRENIPEKEWKSKVKSISVAFPKAAAIMLTNPEKLYKYEKAIREQFLEYRTNVFRDTLFMDIRNSNQSDGPVDLIYGSILNNSKAGKKYMIYVADLTPADFEGVPTPAGPAPPCAPKCGRLNKKPGTRATPKSGSCTPGIGCFAFALRGSSQ